MNQTQIATLRSENYSDVNFDDINKHGKPKEMTWREFRNGRNMQKRVKNRPKMGTLHKPITVMIDGNEGHRTVIAFSAATDVRPIPFTRKLLFRDAAGHVYFDPRLLQKDNSSR